MPDESVVVLRIDSASVVTATGDVIDVRSYLLARRQAILGELGEIEKQLNLKRTKVRRKHNNGPKRT